MMDDDAAGKLPLRETLGRMVRRKRKAEDDQIITEDLLLTPRGADITTMTDNDLGIYIVTIENNLDMLADYPHWFADRTFDYAPQDYQLYTINGLFPQSNKTMVYYILHNKNTDTYSRVFELLEEKTSFKSSLYYS